MSELYDQLEECLGELDARRLVGTLGGTRIEVPNVARGSRLAGVIGVEATQRLIDHLGPGRLTLPMGDVRGQAGRRAAAKKLLTEGRSARDVARETDVHIRTVERYAQALREDDQLSFPFED